MLSSCKQNKGKNIEIDEKSLLTMSGNEEKLTMIVHNTVWDDTQM